MNQYQSQPPPPHHQQQQQHMKPMTDSLFSPSYQPGQPPQPPPASVSPTKVTIKKPRPFSFLPKCFQSKPPAPQHRSLYKDAEIHDDVFSKKRTIQPIRVSYAHYPNNRVVTARYTLINFVPKALFEQMQRLANFYFLGIGLVQLFTDTPVSPYTSFLPLLSVLVLALLKQAYEDFQRHKTDNLVNYKSVKRFDYQQNQFKNVHSQDICVGDIIMCRTDEEIPSDILLLSCIHRDELDRISCTDHCHVTTASLDGETNLKIYYTFTETTQWAMKYFYIPSENIMQDSLAHCDFDQGIIQATSEGGFEINCEESHPDLYLLRGNISFSGHATKRPISDKNVLLRGTRLKSAQCHVIGCVLYSGRDTKMALNSKQNQAKFSRVEHRLNHFIIVYFLILIVISFVSSICRYCLRQSVWYRPDDRLTVWLFIQSALGFMILYSYLLPVSLYITIELQKFIGAFFIRWDLALYWQQMDQPALANTSDLLEELGLVTILFSDKTGTLTENEMLFKACCVKREQASVISSNNLLPYSNNQSSNHQSTITYRDVNNQLCQVVRETDALPKPLIHLSEHSSLRNFLIILALCHSVQVSKTSQSEELIYESSSPDEKAFVEACARYGIIFCGVEDDHYLLKFTETSTIERYRLLDLLEFDADRKCMSVIIQFPDNSVRLLSKGAETAMLQRAVNHNSPEGQASLHPDVVMKQVGDFASEGLRTLVVGCRELTMEQYKTLTLQLRNARSQLDNREIAVKEVYNQIEKSLNLCGCTAVEDKLQDGVGQTIQVLRRAGIQVWVLTGDKVETAVNISHSTGHFPKDCTEIHITEKKTLLETSNALKTQMEGLDADRDRINHSYGIIVDGQTLKFALLSENRSLFLKLCSSSDAVLCCRLTPLQKAEIVTLVKEDMKPTPITAAIGDGANDVSMIREAHVGLGMFGKEGRQAIRNADYALPRFSYLRRLFFVHGHFFYQRISFLLQYFFYKNVVFMSAQFYFAIFNEFSTQTLYHSFFLMTYNMLFTALPILLYSILEQILPQKQLLELPELYQLNRSNQSLSWQHFVKWNLFGLWHSLVIYFSVHYLLYDGGLAMLLNGKSVDMQCLGAQVFAGVWIIVTVKILLSSHFINWYYIVGIFVITLVGNCLLLGVVTEIPSPTFSLLLNMDMLSVWQVIYTNPAGWLMILFVILLAIAPDLIQRCYDDFHLKAFVQKQIKKHQQANKRDIEYCAVNNANATAPTTATTTATTTLNNSNSIYQEKF